MKYLKHFNEGREQNPYNIQKDTTVTDSRILNFNKKFKKFMNVLGLNYEYVPIFIIRDGLRKNETHNYNITLNLASVPYSIFYLLTLKYGSNRVDEIYPYPRVKHTEFEFSINISNPVLSKSIPQLTLEDDLYQKALQYLYDMFFEYLNGICIEDDAIATIKMTKLLKQPILNYIKSNMQSEEVIIPLTLTQKLKSSIETVSSYSFINNLKKKQPLIYSNILNISTNKQDIESASGMDDIGF